MVYVLYTHKVYKNKNINPNNNSCDKKRDKNGKKGDETKSDDKDSNNTCTAGAHVREAALAQDSTGATSDGSNIGTYVSEVTKTNVSST